MFNDKLTLIKSLLSNVCRTLDSFDSINHPEHLNETVCFTEVKSYKTSDSFKGSDSSRYLDAKAKVEISVLGARNMSAKSLSDFVDSKIMKIISSLGFSIYSLQRKPCEFSKLHFRYVISIEFEFDAAVPTASLDGISVAIGSVSEPIFDTYELLLTKKTAFTPLSNGTMLSNVVCPEPTRISLKGQISSNDAEAITTRLKAYSSYTNTITIGETKYPNMLLTGLRVKLKSVTITEITAEFAEVNK